MVLSTKISGHDWQSHCTVKKFQSHGQKKWTKTLFSARPFEDELGKGNSVYPEVPRCKIQIEKIGVSRVDIEPTAWGLDAQVRNLLRIGEEAMKKA